MALSHAVARTARAVAVGRALVADGHVGLVGRWANRTAGQQGRMKASAMVAQSQADREGRR